MQSEAIESSDVDRLCEASTKNSAVSPKIASCVSSSPRPNRSKKTTNSKPRAACSESGSCYDCDTLASMFDVIGGSVRSVSRFGRDRTCSRFSTCPSTEPTCASGSSSRHRRRCRLDSVPIRRQCSLVWIDLSRRSSRTATRASCYLQRSHSRWSRPTVVAVSTSCIVVDQKALSATRSYGKSPPES